MKEIEVSLYDQNYRSPFPERCITVEKDNGKESINSFSLGSREERATLQALCDHSGAIVFGHGTFAIGKTPGEAYFVTALMEQSCKMKYYLDMAKK
jgi:ribulose-5-phosphate 4-epimerase/fuculose-1-phosphate aldolase